MPELYPKPTLRMSNGKKRVYRVYLFDRRSRKRGYGTIWIVLAFIAVIVITIVLADLLTSRKGKEKAQELKSETLTFTECGMVEGLIVKTQGRKIFAYKGIPYAIPPVGKLRWKPPVSMKVAKSCWIGTFSAVKNGNQCTQQGEEADEIIGQEDCLYLNILTPTLNTSRKLPVVFWIHGGAFMKGNGNQVGYTPDENFVYNNDVVAVTLNYRLNIFGFLALRILARFSTTQTSGNYGLLDQIEALKWVARNIGNFGGNSRDITILGHESGGTSVLALMSSPLSYGLFHKAISMNGNSIVEQSHAQAYTINEKFITDSGCSNMTSRDTYICLYELTTAQTMKSSPTSYTSFTTDASFSARDAGHVSLLITDTTPFCSSEHEQMQFLKTRKSTLSVMIGSDHILNYNYRTAVQTSTKNTSLFDTKNPIREQRLPRNKVNTPNNTKHLAQRTVFTRNDSNMDRSRYCEFRKLVQSLTDLNNTVFQYYFRYKDVMDISGMRKYLACKDFYGWGVASLFGINSKCRVSFQAKWTMEIFRKNFRSFLKTGRPSTTYWTSYPNLPLEYNLGGTLYNRDHNTYRIC